MLSLRRSLQRSLASVHHQSRRTPLGLSLRSAISQVSSVAITDDDDDDHDEAAAAHDGLASNTVPTAQTTATITPSNHQNEEAIDSELLTDDQSHSISIRAPDGLSLPSYIAWTVPQPSDQPTYVVDPTTSSSTETNDGDTLESKPTPGGNWNPQAPLEWSQNFGRRSVETATQLAPLIKLKPGDEGYFDNSNTKVKGITIVQTKEHALQVLEKLNSAPEGIFHACDTEVMAIDLKKVGPVGNGYVTCVSVYSGPDFDYGDGPGTALWIDNLDESAGLLELFKEWFENPKHLKVWHNYGFDRHVMWNEGINVLGFGGDTMHMARLQDTSRSKLTAGGGGGGYSLEALSEELVSRRKKPMKEIFGINRLRKDGTPGALVDIPAVEVLQRDPQHRELWIRYSAYDAEGTWMIRHELQKLLEEKKWIDDQNLYDYYQEYMRTFGEVLTDMERRGIRVDAKDYLASVEVQARKDRTEHVANFRRWAAKQIGIDALAMNLSSSVQLNTFLFGGAANEKTKEISETTRVFKTPREDIPDEAMEAYRARDAQEKAQSTLPPDKDIFADMKADQLKKVCKEVGLKTTGKKIEIVERLRGYFLFVGKDDESDNNPTNDEIDKMTDVDLRDALAVRTKNSKGTRKQMLKRLKDDIAFVRGYMCAEQPQTKSDYERMNKSFVAAAENLPETKEILDEVLAKNSEEPKYVDVTIKSIGMEPEKFTVGGAPSATADVIKKLAGEPIGDDPRFGTAYEFFNGGDEGREACEALASLAAVGSIDTMIANFLTSLQFLADDASRVHGSVNLNTETGRLSSRRPNLQNQPALEKDKYKIRQAFQACPGNSLIVCDYGQLELRLLASMTKCKSMITAFEAGGDFHSRTALDMFDYVREKVDAEECLLEWDYSQGDPPKPLLKDLFASERRKAKTLNFSIAYGKTAYGLSHDWGVTKEEAEEMLQAWYDARPEVLNWQQNRKRHAREKGETRTLMGRYRQLPEAQSKNRRLLGHAERASINTPIQGGAADVVMMAMLKVNANEKLKRLGWILLMQIHDEVILEGPEETAEEAFVVVKECMESPWVYGLEKTLVPLLVDGSYEYKNWYDAK